MTGPVFLIAPGRTFTSVVGSMIGQHPSMFGLAETNLTIANTIGEWLLLTAGPNRIYRHGLLRTLAYLIAGEQSALSVQQAEQWLRMNAAMPTEALFRKITEQVAPLRVVEKSPLASFSDEHLRRLAKLSPMARYVHITRHPFTYAQSVMRSDLFRKPLEQTGLSQDHRVFPPVFDPQVQWLDTHRRIGRFLDTVPKERWIRLRGEDILADPSGVLQGLCRWLGIDDGPGAIESMMHPEASPFACVGPLNAPTGNDPGFMRDPVLRPYKAQESPLLGPLPWRKDGMCFAAAVVELARAFGYEDVAASKEPEPARGGGRALTA